MCLCVIACVGELGVVTVHICLSPSIFFSHCVSVCVCRRMQRVYTVVCLCEVSECICGKRYFCVCISRAHCLDRENENGWDCNY